MKDKRRFTHRLVGSLFICALAVSPFFLFANDLTDGSEVRGLIAGGILTFLGVSVRHLAEMWKENHS